MTSPVPAAVTAHPACWKPDSYSAALRESVSTACGVVVTANPPTGKRSKSANLEIA